MFWPSLGLTGGLPRQQAHKLDDSRIGFAVCDRDFGL
jgi:hypothetical protein